jgi:oxygen tolerance protein BatD
MMRAAAISIAPLVAVLATVAAIAQQAAEPEPILRATVDPPRVVVGQRATLRVDVLAPNYMTAPPEKPEFQIRNAVTRKLQSVNLSEQQDGTSYAGVRYEFAIYPQEEGSFAIADQKITVKYAARPPQTREATLSVRQIALEAFIPEAAAQLDPFVAATRLTIEQNVQRSSDPLKVGGSVIRTVTIEAEGTPAMLLPPTAFPPVDGLTLYPAQPSLQDHIDERTDVLSASRVDTGTYMIERAGEYLLPAVTIRWWNAGSGKVEIARLDTIDLRALDDPAAVRAPAAQTRATGRDSVIDLVARRWPAMLIVSAMLMGLLWLLPGIVRSARDWCRARRDAYLASESRAFSSLRTAARHRDAARTYSALLLWLERFEPVAPSHTIKALTVQAQDAVLAREIEALEQKLFGQTEGAEWSARALVGALRTARRRLLRQAAQTDKAQPLPQQLNPVVAKRAAPRRLHVVVRQ